MNFDTVIHSGTVLDPARGINGKYDLAIHNGRIAGLFPPGGEARGRTVIDAGGCFVVPGLIDIHAHVFPGATSLGIEADRVGVRQGVTTVLDAGSAGADNFSQFVKDIVDPSSTEVMAWVNIAGAGLSGGRAELADIGQLDVARAVELIGQWPLIRGIKVRMSRSVLGASGLTPLKIAKEAAAKARVPLMVHIGNGPPGLKDILDLLDGGDVVTHAFHGKPGGILDEEGELTTQARKALARGVLFDVGHGKESFSFHTMARVKKLGIKSFTISTDIHRENYQGPVYSLATTLSKFLALGYSLAEVVAAATVLPAKLLRLADSHGSLERGRTADITILSSTGGAFDFVDSENNHLNGGQLLEPRYTIKAGKVLTCE